MTQGVLPNTELNVSRQIFPQMHTSSLSVKAWILLVWGTFVLLQGIQRAVLMLAAWARHPGNRRNRKGTSDRLLAGQDQLIRPFKTFDHAID
jgi:hypothetical protein